MSTQDIEQRVGLGAAQPLMHAKWEAPPSEPPTFAQAGVGSEHTVVQSPQCETWLRSVVQPAATSDGQWAFPGRHAPPILHAPTTHATAAGSMPGSFVQSVWQSPQWLGLVRMSTHFPPHSVCPVPHAEESDP